ncbi:MAG: AraC family transcriptional regulator, partial [Pseudomonadota bacterium]
SPSLGLIAYAAVVTSRRLWQYRAWIAKEHANRKRVDLSWLGRALLAIVLLALVWMLSDFIQQVFGQWSYAINFYVYLFAAIMFLAMSLDFLSKVDRLYPKYGPASEREVSSPKAQNDDQIDLDALRSKVRSRGWHLDPDLSLNDLARHLATNKSTLSAWLNSEEDGNFSTFVNGLRVDEVCERLKAAKEKPNLLLIAFQCGFGSKATFNRAFKQQTGQSPRDWLRALDKEFAA